MKTRMACLYSPGRTPLQRPLPPVPTGQRLLRSLPSSRARATWRSAVRPSSLMHKEQTAKPANAAEVLKFFQWAYASGDAMASDCTTMPLPKATVDQIKGLRKGQIKDASASRFSASDPACPD